MLLARWCVFLINWLLLISSDRDRFLLGKISMRLTMEMSAMAVSLPSMKPTVQSLTIKAYIAFMILMFAGAVLAWGLADAGNVRRADGSHVIIMKNPTWRSEIFGMWEVFRSDPYIVLLFPMFIASNYFYTYQFNDVNLAKFNTRTRGTSQDMLMVRLVLTFLSAKQHSLLVESDRWRIHIRVRSRYKDAQQAKSSQRRSGCSIHYYHGHLGWRLCVAKTVHTTRSFRQDLREG